MHTRDKISLHCTCILKSWHLKNHSLRFLSIRCQTNRWMKINWSLPTLGTANSFSRKSDKRNSNALQTSAVELLHNPSRKGFYTVSSLKVYCSSCHSDSMWNKHSLFPSLLLTDEFSLSEHFSLKISERKSFINVWAECTFPFPLRVSCTRIQVLHSLLSPASD